MTRQPRLGRRAVRTLLVACVLAVGVVALVLNLPDGGPSGAFGGEPLPTLFPDDQIAIIGPLVAPEQARADATLARWERTHPTRDDAAVTRLALSTVGAPPSGAEQSQELAELHRIDAHRTQGGIAASTWLEAHGKKDIWKLYLKQYGQQTDRVASKRAKTVFKATYALANTIEADAKAYFARPSPYITDPTLHAVNQQKFAKKFSYPSKHTVLSFALADVLSHDDPHRSGEYRWMADEISYSRLYAGGHYPSDIAAGAYIGRLVADYELGHAQ